MRSSREAAAVAITADAAVPAVVAASLAAAFAVTLSHAAVVDAAPVRAPGPSHAVAAFFSKWLLKEVPGRLHVHMQVRLHF